MKCGCKKGCNCDKKSKRKVKAYAKGKKPAKKAY